MSLLCLDLGTTTGWAILLTNGQVQSGTQSFKPGRFEGGGMRYLKFQNWLGDIKEFSNGIERVAFEEVRRHLGVDAAHAYGGFLATLTGWCEAEHIPYEGVPVATIKKSICGKGNASKIEVVAAIRNLGYSPGDDNEADALAILGWLRDKDIGTVARGPSLLASRQRIRVLRTVIPRERVLRKNT